MKSSELLKDLTIFDFTSRLPGPLASSFLCDLGADVYKIELRDDPFSTKNEHEPIFNTWYKRINKNKEISTTLPSKKCDVVIVSNRHSKKIALESLSFKVFIELITSEENIKMHDLNALAQSETFKHMNTSELPFLPIMGYSYSWKIATELLACLYRYNLSETQIHHKVYFDDLASKTIDKLSPNSDRSIFLHNGKFPCNRIYKLKDNNRVAVASIEEKLWLKLCDVLEISLHSHDRFDNTSKTTDILQSKFSNLSSNDIKKIIKDNNICLTLI